MRTEKHSGQSQFLASLLGIVGAAQDSKVLALIGATERERHDVVNLKSMARGATTILCGVLTLAATAGEDLVADRSGEVHSFSV